MSDPKISFKNLTLQEQPEPTTSNGSASQRNLMSSKFLNSLVEGKEATQRNREAEAVRKADEALKLKRAEEQRAAWLETVFKPLCAEFTSDMRSARYNVETAIQPYKDFIDGDATKIVVECKDGANFSFSPPIWITIRVESSNYVSATIGGDSEHFNIPVANADADRITGLFKLLARRLGERTG